MAYSGTVAPVESAVTVAKGDTLSALARKYNTTIQSFMQANPDKIKDPNRIYVGQSLNIPQAQAGALSPTGSGSPAQTKAPTVPQGATPQGGQTSGQPGEAPAVGVPSMGFYYLMQDMKDRLSKNDDLIKRKNTILTHLYDRPLSDEEKSSLSPSDMRAIESGNRDLVDLNLRLINDELKGRVDSLDNTFDFLIRGYEKEQQILEKKADNARQQLQWAIGTYGKEALKALLPTGEFDLDKLSGMSTIEQQREARLGKDAGTQTLDVLDIERYIELYPEAGIVAGDTKASAEAKVAKINTPEAKIRSQVVAAKDAGNTYDVVEKEIEGDSSIKDKDTAIKIAQEVYGITEKVEPDIFGKGNFSDIRIDDRVNQLKEVYGSLATKPYLREQLYKDGYPIQEIKKRTDDIFDKTEDFVGSIFKSLFGK